MPYSTPSPTQAPLPVRPQGRPGHRRSFSEMAHNDFAAPAAPRPTSGAFAPLGGGALPRRKPASFHLEADDDDDSSPEDEAGSNATGRRDSPTETSSPSLASFRPTLPGRPAHLPDDEDDELARGLPPLKLKIPNGALNLPFSGSPTTAAAPNTLPFPRTISPPRSRSASTDNLTPGRPYSPVPRSAPHSGANTPTRTDSPKPHFTRTASTPVLLSNASSSGGRILLSNGKPLKSSLKSSSSSPNIPFPSQSLVPSRIYAEIAAAQQREREERQQSRTGTPTAENQHYYQDDQFLHSGHERMLGFPDLPMGNRHARAASAPALPSLVMMDDDGSASAPSSPLDTAPPTPSVPKAVHFPSSDDGGALATVKFFRRSARPASLSLPGASGGEETETETDGEGYNSGTGATGSAGVYSGYNANTSWGWGGYVNPWDRYTAAGAANKAGAGAAGRGPGGYPFPRIVAGKGAASSPLAQQPQQQPQPQPQQTPKVVITPVPSPNQQDKKTVYELDSALTTTMPRSELSLFDNVFLEGVELSSTGVQQVTLTGTLLVRNLAYEKHVSLRFTLDEWHTTSEVKAAYKESLERLPEKWVAAMRGERDTTSTVVGTALQLGSAAPVNPQWDRFGFSLDLSDYARSRSLVNRTLWMVVRFAVPGPVRVPIPVTLLLKPALGSLTTPPGQTQDTKAVDVLSPSDGEMLSTLIAGVAGAPHYDQTAQDRYARGRNSVEELLRIKGVCVGVGVGTEWWDNNGSLNFRIGFKEVDVPQEGGVQQQQQEQQAEKEIKKRANAISCPTPMFGLSSSPPPPMSILDKSLSHSSLSPPQISISTSLDSSTNNNNGSKNGNGTTGYNSNMVISSLALATYPNGPLMSSTNANVNANYGGLATTTTNGGTPTNAWPTRTPAATKAMAETTLERLKRLNLRNYAAPVVRSPAAATSAAAAAASTTPATTAAITSVANPGLKVEEGGSGPPSRTSSTSSTSSAASWGGSNSPLGSEGTPMTSPVGTPTSSSVDVRFGLDDKTPKAVGENVLEGRPALERNATVVPRAPIAISSPAATAVKKKEEEEQLLGAFMSGPGGAFDLGANGRRKGGDGQGVSALTLGTSPPFSMLGEGGGWSALAAPAPVPAAAAAASPALNQSLGSEVVRSGEATPTPASVGAGAGMRGLPPKSLVMLDNIREKSTGSGRSSPVGKKEVGKAGSGSDSGSSKSGSGSGGSGGSKSGRRHSPQQHQQQRSGSGPGLVFKPGQSFSGSSSSGSSSSLSSFTGATRKQPQAGGVRSPISVAFPTSPGSPPPGGAPSPPQTQNVNSRDDIRDPDSIYQAFVKQWCFASGPAPAQAAGFAAAGSGEGRQKVL